MSDTNNTNDNAGNKPSGHTLSLKRPAVDQSRVKQSFSHGRSKTVVVETKRKRFGEDARPTPAAADNKPGFQAKPRVAGQSTTIVLPQATTNLRPAPATTVPRAGVVLRTLTADERDARERALADSKVREAQERKKQEEDLLRRR